MRRWYDEGDLGCFICSSFDYLYAVVYVNRHGVGHYPGGGITMEKQVSGQTAANYTRIGQVWAYEETYK